MPASDNPYSTDDAGNSERDSFSNELSPADGQLSRGNIMSPDRVPEPSSIDNEPEPKTLIAPPQRSAMGENSRLSLHSLLPSSSSSRNSAAAPSQQNNPTSPMSYNPPSPDIIFSEHSPLVNGPPPAYSPGPASPAFSQDTSGRYYNTIPEEERGFLINQEPQSMGGPIDDDITYSSRTPRSPFRTFMKKVREATKKLLLGFLILIGSFSILVYFLSNRASNNPSKIPIDHVPVRERPIDAEGPYCGAARYRDDEITYEFPVDTDLSVVQTTHDNEQWGNAQLSTVGEIRLRRIPQDSKHGNKPYFTISAHVSDPELEVLKTWDEESRLLTVSTPRYAQLADSGNHCISLEITAWFPEDAKFTNILVESVSLTLRIMEDINVNVSGRAKFSSVIGDVWFPTVDDDTFYHMDHEASGVSAPATSANQSSEGLASPFSSRHIVVETVSGSINGAYPLKDILAISSQSGSIEVQVLPKAASETSPAPADLEIESSSGSIKAFLPLKSPGHQDYTPPPRNYITHVHTNAGSIEGSFYLGSESNFKSNSGSIKIKTMPVLQSGSSNAKYLTKSVFETHTLSGPTDIDVQDPIFISPVQSASISDEDPYPAVPSTSEQPLFTIDSRALSHGTKLHSLKSVHSSNAAGVRVHYPNVWEGTMHGKTVAGGIKTFGEGIRIIKQRKGYGYTELLVRRGVEEKEDGCTVELKNIAGDLQFALGP